MDVSAEVAPATDDAAGVHTEQRDDAAELGAEDLQVADDEAFEDADDVAEDAEAVDQEDLGAEDLQHAGDDVSKAADQEPSGATCAYCNHPFGSLDQRHVINGRLYHDGFCLDYAKRIAIAAE